jgi:DNA-binding beta-propeller fold protein YncE
MKFLTRTAVAAAFVAATATGVVATPAGSAFAATSHQAAPARSGDGGADHAVFVQTDSTAGNQVISYRRSDDGRLSWHATYATGGLGGVLTGSVVDHLASQGSLAYDPNQGLVIAVNAGSGTISVFAARGDDLSLRQVLPSGGAFPVSVAVDGSLVYVLNAELGGDVAGFRVSGDRLRPIPHSTRALGLDPSATPQFTNTPGQVAFSPDGSELIVTTKANGNDVDVFAVRHGRLSAAPTVNPEPGTVPFALAFDAAGHVLVAEAGPNAVASFSLSGTGALTEIGSVATGQAATCWIAPAGRFFYASDAGSGSVSGFRSGPAGVLTGVGATSTDPGTVDASASTGGRYLYVQAGGSGVVDEFKLGPAGSLTEIGSVTVPGAAGGEGIVAR